MLPPLVPGQWCQNWTECSACSHNGHPFNGHNFIHFNNYLGIQRELKTLLNPQANVEAEQFIRVLKKLYQITKITGANFKQDLYRSLRAYLATMHCSAKVEPADPMYPGPKIRFRMPVGAILRRYPKST